MPKSAPFSEYEATILLDAFLQVDSGSINKRDAVRKCSEALRQLAVSQGIAIDEKYRNVAGITFQMASMESAYRGETILKPATKLFEHIVDMYRNDRGEYERILKKARLMAENKLSNESKFMGWLSKKVTPAQLSELFLASKEVEEQAKKEGIIAQSLYTNIDANNYEKIRTSLRKNKLFGLLHKRQMKRINSFLDYLIEYATEEKAVTDSKIEPVDNTISNTTEDGEQYSNHTSADIDNRSDGISDNDSYVKTKDSEAERINNSYNQLRKAYNTTIDETLPRHFIRDDKEQFFRWLIDKEKLSEDKSAQIVRTLKQAEDYAKECIDSNCRLLSGSANEIVKTIENLSQNEEFVKRNYLKNNKFFRALRLFVECVEEDLGQLTFSKNIIIYNQSGKAFIRSSSYLQSYTVYKQDIKKNGQTERDNNNIEAENDNNAKIDENDEPKKSLPEKQQIADARNVSLDNTEIGYFNWLNKKQALNETSCKRHIAAVLIAERYVLMNDYSNHRLFGSDNYNAKEIINRVLDDDRFVKTYSNYITALKKYRSFLEYILYEKEDSEESPASLEIGTASGEVAAKINSTFVNVNSVEQYRNWLSNYNMPEQRCKKLIEGIFIAERYALLNDYSPYKLFGVDNASAAHVVYDLLDNDQFLKTYEIHKYALRMYLRFLEQVELDYNQKSVRNKKSATDNSEKSKRINDIEDSVGIRNDDDLYRLKYPDLYSKLSIIAGTYYRPNGMTVNDICRMIGVNDKRSVIEVLDHVSWASKDESGKRYVLQSNKSRHIASNKTAQYQENASESGERTRNNSSVKETYSAKTEREDFDKSKFIDVLMHRFRSGMLFDSIDFDIFRDTYSMLFNEELNYNDASLSHRLRKCGVVYKDRLFPAEGVIDNDLKERLFTYIDNSFSSGNKVIYYKAIFEDLADEFANCYALVDEEMLRAYLEYAAEPGKYYFSSKYISKEKYVTADPTKEVEEYLLSSGKPMNVEDVCSALSHIPNDQIIGIIRSDPTFLRNAKGEYYHIGIFEISKEELQKIVAIINDYISEEEYVIWNDVWNAIQDRMPAFIENNPYLSSLGIRNAVARRCSDKFNFGASVISLPGNNYRMWDIYHLYAKHHKVFSADDIYRLSKELDTVIYFDAIADVSVRVSYDKFVSKDLISFDTDSIDKTISSFMSKDYIRIREIDSFIAFPNVGYEWNEYLLESFLLSYSKKHKLLNNGLSLNNVAGVIVKRAGKIKTFVDACAAVLAEGNVELKKEDALTYLVKSNMITRRSYKDIDEAISKASQIRLKRGN